MIKKSDNSCFKLKQQFLDKDVCLDFIFRLRANKEESGSCYKCGSNLNFYHKLPNSKRWRPAYQCKCGFQVHPLVGTIFQNTHISLEIWFQVIIDKISLNSGISGNSIANNYGLSDGTAWTLLHKVRELMASYNDTIGRLSGTVEIDESALNTGSKGLCRHRKKKRGFSSDTISPCLSIVERGGNVKSFMIKDRQEDSLLQPIMDSVEFGSKIFTDEFRGYSKVKSLGYKHEKVNHSKNEYARGEISTNAVEGYFGLVKPNLKGTYRQISEKYAQNYLEEHDFRYNCRFMTINQKLESIFRTLPPLFSHIQEQSPKSA